MNKIKIKINNGVSLSEIRNLLSRYQNSEIVLEIDNTKKLFTSNIDLLMREKESSRILFRIVGGYDDDRVKNYPNNFRMHTEDNIYSLHETKRIIQVIEDIEAGIKPEWDDFQKLIYLIHTLKRKIIYHPFHEIQPSKDIRSLRGLLSNKTVCAGYALILKELCDRQGIECQYVEGCTKEEDYNKDYLTHAWNIVKLNGYYIPIDLTWNAGADRRGKSLSIEDIANVNEFIKNHIPGKYEKIRDYKKNLKSIDGTKMRSVNNLINKDTTYDTRIFSATRKDGTKYIVTELEQIVRDNKYIYKYLYQDILKDGKLGPPVILYSDINVALIVDNLNRKNKLEKQLKEASKRGDTKKVNEIKKQLIGSEHLEKTNENIDELLFSITNIQAAIDRKDYYIGTIEIETDEFKRTKYKRTFVDPEFGKKLSLKQRTIKKSDGTYIVLQEWPWNQLTKRYVMLEPTTKTNNENYTVKRQTIFTDNDILSVRNQNLADWFLSKNRINKYKSYNGYLGKYNDQKVDIFSNENISSAKALYNNSRLKNNDIKDYFAEITFDEMKRLVRTYAVEYKNGKYICYNRLTKAIITDHNLILHIKFASYWLGAAGIKWSIDEPVPGYNYAFNESAEELFNQLKKFIINSLNKDGNIDPIEIYDKIEKESYYKYSELILVRLFNNRESTQVINELFRLQNPSSIKAKTDILYFLSRLDAFQKLSEKRRLEAQKQILEIIKNNQNVEMIPKNNR